MAQRKTEGKPERPGKKNTTFEIDENLRRVYEDMIDDDIPDRFVELLRKLREKGE